MRDLLLKERPPGEMSAWRRFWFCWRNAYSIALIERELRHYRELNQDLDHQVRELIKAHPMTEAQLEEIRMVRADNESMKKEQDILTIYLRTRFPEDFQSGRHGVRSFSEILIHYLARLPERDHAAAT